jgi:hypothetical protein
MTNLKPFVPKFCSTHSNVFLARHLQRRSSKDVRGDSVSEWEKRLEKPSVPLMAKGPPGPPKIVEIEEKYSAIEGKLVQLQKNND